MVHQDPDWFCEETLKDIADSFEELTKHPEEDALEELKILRACWDREAMQLAVKRLSEPSKAKLWQLVKDLNSLERLEKLTRVAEQLTLERRF